jgi:hypothetical protein
MPLPSPLYPSVTNPPSLSGRLLLAAAVCSAAAAGAVASTVQPLEPAPVAGSHALFQAPADPDHFVFAVAGDNRATGRDVPMPPTAAQIFSEYRLLRPAFSLWTGDVIYGADDTPGEADAEYDVFLAAAAQSRTPLFNAPGNHEINNRADLEAVYRRRMGALYGSFDYGHSHFIGLDTDELNRKPGLGPAQLRWLRADLEANAAAKTRFVFMHFPLFPKVAGAGWPDVGERDEVHHLLVRYHVTAVFAGHEHMFYESTHDGLRYVVTGGAGAPTAGLEEGGYAHYLLIHVNGTEASVSVLAPWRLFAEVGPVAEGGACTGRVDNYQAEDLAVTIEFPTDRFGRRAAASATIAYKDWSHAVSAEVLAPAAPGATAVRVTVPRGRSAFVRLGSSGPPDLPSAFMLRTALLVFALAFAHARADELRPSL